MKAPWRIMTGFLLLTLSVRVAWAAEAIAFAQKPSATKAGSDIRISFAVSAPTDVDVAVLGAQEKEVRHLAAGKLGEKEAAAPLAAGALTQSVVWNGKDDRGHPVPASAGPFKVRVRLGMGAGGARVLAVYPRGSDGTGKGKTAKQTEPNTAQPYVVGLPGLTQSKVDSGEGKDIEQLHPWVVEADKEDDRLYFGVTATVLYRYEGKKGTIGPLNMADKDRRVRDSIFSFTVAYNGDLVWSPYFRYDRNLKEVPPPPGLHIYSNCVSLNYGLLSYQRARPLHEYWSGTLGIEGLDGRAYHRCGYQIPYQRITVWDTWEKGRTMRDGFQKIVSPSGNRGHSSCIRVDTSGYFYMTMHGGPADMEPPPRRVKTPFGEYGSIIKLDIDKRWEKDFSYPYAGKPADPEEAKKAIPWSNVKGEYLSKFERVYPYCIGGVPAGCNCKSTHFDIDEYGRLFVPDLCQENVFAMDNVGNRIFKVQDTVSADADGKSAKLFLGWPARVAVSRQALYFSDPVNNRIMRIALAWRTEESCPLP